ncbi:hypothetical protein Tco_0548027 [Tanacetum coccineum]
MIKPEVPLKRKDQIALDEQIARDIQAKLDAELLEEQKLAREQEEEANIALIEVDGSSKRYSSMIRMLQRIDREDLEALWRTVKEKYGDTRPEDEFERVLYGDLGVMFEPDIKSDVWRMLQGYRIQKMNINFRGGFLGLKRLHGFLEVTAAQCCLWKDYDCLKTFYCQEDKDELKR